MKALTKAAAFCVVCRTGDPLNTVWVRSEPMTHAAAVAARQECERNGLKALTFNYAQSVAIGLPEGWEFKHAT